MSRRGTAQRLCSDGYEFPCCGRNYAFLTQTGLPKAFHRLMRLAMITPSHSCEAIFCVSRVAPMHRLMREICAYAPRTPTPFVLAVRCVTETLINVTVTKNDDRRCKRRSCAPSFKRSLDGSRIAQQALAERPSVSAPAKPHQRFPQRLT